MGRVAGSGQAGAPPALPPSTAPLHGDRDDVGVGQRGQYGRRQRCESMVPRSHLPALLPQMRLHVGRCVLEHAHHRGKRGEPRGEPRELNVGQRPRRRRRAGRIDTTDARNDGLNQFELA